MKHIALGVLLSVATLLVGANVAAAQDAGSCYVFNNDLSQGMTFGEVLELQKFLVSEGSFTAEMNGTFGPLTKAALAQYQSKNGIQATGYFGPATRAHVNARCGEVLGEFASSVTTAAVLTLNKPDAGTYEAGSLVAYKWVPSRMVDAAFGAYEFGLVDSSNKLTKLKDFTTSNMTSNALYQPANIEQLNKYRVVRIPTNLPAGEYRTYIKFKPDNVSAYGATISVVKKGRLDDGAATSTQNLPLVVELPVTGVYTAGSKIAFQWSNDDKKMMSTGYRVGVVDEDGTKLKLEGSRSSPEGAGSLTDGRVHFFREVSLNRKFEPGTYKTFVEHRKSKEIGYGPEITIVAKGSTGTTTTPTQPGTTTDSALRSSGTGRFKNPASPLLMFAPDAATYELGKTIRFGWEAHGSALPGLSNATEFEFGLQNAAGTMTVLTKVANGNTYTGSNYSFNNNTEARNGWIVGRRVAKLPTTLAAGSYKPFVRIKQNGMVAFGDTVRLAADKKADNAGSANDDSGDDQDTSGTENQQGQSTNTGTGSSSEATVTPKLTVEKTKTGSVVVTVGPALKPDRWRYTITCNPAKTEVDGCPVSGTVNNKTAATYVKQKLYELPAAVFSKFEAATVKVEALNGSGAVIGTSSKTIGR